MKAYPLGKIAVPTSGTPVQVTANTAVVAAKVEFTADPAMAGATATVKDSASGTVIAQLLKPANGVAGRWETPTFQDGNPIRVSDFAVDAATANDGVFVTYWVN
jgi:hypothetical protein